MPKSHRLEDTLAALNRLRDDPSSDAALAQLRQVLKGKSSHATAKAAQIAGESEISALAPDLLAAFEQFMVNPGKSDPNCHAKAAIADALYRMGCEAETVFLRGIRHRQMEPVYGGRIDTAPDLRAACALGLVRMNHPQALVELADLLADPEPRVRAAAAQAVAYHGSDHGVPLLRLKVLSGDEDATVISECLAALLRLAPASSLAFAARLLDAAEPSISEAAALALGGSRLPAAFDVLHQWWDRITDITLRRTALLAIAMLRRDQALDFLIGLINEANGPTAREAIAALAVYRHDDTVRQRVEACVTQRTDVDLRKAFAEAFWRGGQAP
jgi:HEAT repeat protein